MRSFSRLLWFAAFFEISKRFLYVVALLREIAACQYALMVDFKKLLNGEEGTRRGERRGGMIVHLCRGETVSRVHCGRSQRSTMIFL